MKTSKLIKLDANKLRAELTYYMKEFIGVKIYITKYNKIIGEMMFYSDKEKRKVKLEIAKEILKGSLDISDIEID